MALVNSIDNDIKAALKAKDQARLRALRSIKSALLLAQTEKGASRDLSADTELKILQKLAKQRNESLELYEQQNREDLAIKEREELAVIQEYLPKQMTPVELETALNEIIAEVGATSPQDIGKVMGVASKRLAGKAPGQEIAAMAKKLLS